MPPRSRIMLRAALLLLTTSEGVAIADESTGDSYCAEIVSASSSVYEQSPGDWHFSFTFKVHRWVPKMHISIAFGEPVVITNWHQGASEVDQYYYGQGVPSRLEHHSLYHPAQTRVHVDFVQWTTRSPWSSWTTTLTWWTPRL